MSKKEVSMFLDDKTHLTFDDVCLVTGLCDVNSRSGIDLTSSFPKEYEIGLPVMTAAMDTITSHSMARATLNEGGAIVHHRNQPMSDRVELVGKMKDHHLVRERKALNGVAVGLGVTTTEIEELISSGANLIALEVAHAYMTSVIETVKRIGPICKEKEVLLMVGNFSCVDGVNWLRHKTGDLVDIVKVSQGGGSCCTTRIVTGMGKPTLQAVIDLTEAETPYHVVADGGIRNSGALAKALGAGACAGMLGGLLSGTDETPGQLVEREDGKLSKEFRGMASTDAKKEVREGKIKNVEGISTYVPYKGPVKKVFDQVREGLQSAVASTGFQDLTGFQKEVQFIRVSHSSQLESLPHARLLKEK